MFDLGWGELLLVGIVALIVIGPKDLPGMFRTLGRMTGKIRRMAREFQRAMEDAADESGVGDIAGDLRKVANPKSMGLDAVKDAAKMTWNHDEVAEKAHKLGPETEKLKQERAEQVAKIKDSMAKKGAEKLEAETAKAEAPEPAKKAPTKKSTAKKTTAKKASPAKKKAPSKKTAAKPKADGDKA